MVRRQDLRKQVQAVVETIIFRHGYVDDYEAFIEEYDSNRDVILEYTNIIMQIFEGKTIAEIVSHRLNLT
jgi:hypothetical protein